MRGILGRAVANRDTISIEDCALASRVASVAADLR
jgi:hypothetical protein